MDGRDLMRARRSAHLTQAALARVVGTSRETVSAYENGRKSPTLDTLNRLFEALGAKLAVQTAPRFVEVAIPHGRPAAVPDVLPRLPVHLALATVSLPLHLDWSPDRRAFDLADRRQRARMYEIVLREGTPEDIMTYIDGVLLVELWDELVIPTQVRGAWAATMDRAGAAA